MERLLARARAVTTLIAVVMMVVFMGGIAFVVGLIYPSRTLMNFFSYAFSRIILVCTGVRLTVSGSHRPNPDMPAFYLGNHQSALDIPILIQAFGGNVRFLAKDSLFRIPIFGWVIGRYGYVPIDRGNARRTLHTLQQMLARIRKRPISFVAFPEGTRSRDGMLLPFRRGTMKIAQETGLTIIPFAIQGSISVLHPQRLLDVRPGAVTLTFGEPVRADVAAAMSPTDLKTMAEQEVAVLLGQAASDHSDKNALAQKFIDLEVETTT